MSTEQEPIPEGQQGARLSQIIRVEKTVGFTVLKHAYLERTDLSGRAKAVLSLLLSKPNHWTVTTKGIEAQMMEGRDYVRAALQDLEKAGYLVRRTIRKPDGRYTTESTVYEDVNTTLTKSAFLANATGTEKPSPTDIPSATAKPSLVNTEEYKKEPPPKEKKAKAPEIHPSAESVYEGYPRKVGRQEALKAITKVLAGKHTPDQLKVAVSGYAKTVLGKEEQFVLHCSTFFNKRRFEDYLTPSPDLYSSPRPAEPALKHARNGLKLGKW